MTTRVRLSFAVPRHDQHAFAGCFESKLCGPLERLGLRNPASPDRPQASDRFVRVFETDGVDPGLGARLEADAAWLEAVAAAAVRVDAAPRGFWELSAYSTPAGPGRTVECGPGDHHGPWHCLGVRDGLPTSLIVGLVRDGEDHLWLQTHQAGICRFDGESFTTFTTADGLPHDTVSVLRAGPGAVGVWALTAAGLCRFDGTAFVTYTRDDGLPAPPAGLSLLSVGGLWVWGAGGLVRFGGEAFQSVPGLPSGASVSCLAQGPDGRLWVGTAGDGLWSWESEGDVLRCRVVASDLPAGPVRALRFDRRGRVWVATESGTGCLREDGFAPARLPGTADRPTWFLAEDRRGRLWFGRQDELLGCSEDLEVRCRHQASGQVFGTPLEDRHGRLWLPAAADGGLLRFDDRGLVRFTTREGLGHNRVYGLVDDRDGNVWVGSWGGGLNRYDGHRFTTYTSADGLSADEVESIATDAAGRIWFATRTSGACCFDGEGFTRLTTADGLGADFVWCVMCDAAGRMWFGTRGGGACCLDGRRLRTYTTADGLVHDSVWRIVEDSHRALWFTTQGGGVCRLDGETFTGYGVEDGLPHPWVWSAVEDADGRMWFATYAGLSRLDGDRFTTFTTRDGLAHNNVWCCHRAGDGRLWFGTWGGGVSVWDPEAEGFRTFTTADGLADNNVRAISEDPSGRLWLSTYGGGVCLYDGQVFQTLSRQDGLVHDAVQDVCFDAAGRAWIATEDGVSCYDPSVSTPRVRLRGVIADEAYDARQSVSVPSSQKFVIFEFAGASFTTPRNRLAYVHRLAGVDDDWQTTYGRRAEYDDLPVGSYRFEVRAVDRDLNYSAPTAVELSVVPDAARDRMQALEAQLSQPQGLEQFIGSSPALRRALDQARTVADTDVTVLILGETGTGKGLAARAVHAMSRRAEEPFLQVNCGALPEGLVESELFGHEQGAFTGALSRRLGRFELADGGTLFLDEIGDLPLDSQQVLLQVLQDGTFQRVGGREAIRVDVRVLAATNRDLSAAMRQGTFREDLYYRLSAFVLHLPPLRERRQDVPLLVEHFVERFARHLNRDVPDLEPAALDYLRAHRWPGNVRELEHVIQRAVLVCREGILRLEDLFLDVPPGPAQDDPPGRGAAWRPGDDWISLDDHQRQLDDQQRQLIESALRATNWVVYGERGAARLLGTHPEKLRVRMRRLGLQRPG